jgi:hypothetical protein
LRGRKAANVLCDRKAANVLCDREAVNVLCDREAVNILEFTFFSLLKLVPAKPGPTSANLGLARNCFRSPGGFHSVLQT